LNSVLTVLTLIFGNSFHNQPSASTSHSGNRFASDRLFAGDRLFTYLDSTAAAVGSLFQESLFAAGRDTSVVLYTVTTSFSGNLRLQLLLNFY
jgi:hypothetical protein